MSSYKIDYTKNIFCACIWPKAEFSKNRVKILSSFQDCKIIAEKSYHFKQNKFRYFVFQVYCKHPWSGSASNYYLGSAKKAFHCWKKREACHFIFFEAESTEKVLAMKKEIRKMLKMDNHSIHITDNNEETMQLERLILNENSLEFINKGRPDRYPFIEKRIQKFVKYADEAGINREHYAFDSSVLLALYGLRRPRDIDFLTTDEKCMTINVFDCDCHNSCPYYLEPIEQLVEENKNYFWWNGNKYITLSVISRMKQIRNEKKDQRDVYLIEKIVQTNKYNLAAHIALLFINIANDCKLLLRKIYKSIKR